MLEQRHDIGKGLVKGRHVRVGGFLQRRCSPSSRACDISWAMMSLDRQENTIAPGAVAVGPRLRENSRTAARPCRDCNRHCRCAGRADRAAAAAPRYFGVFQAVLVLRCSGAAPRAPCAPAPPEMADGRHGHRIDHLLVKSGIALGRRPAVLRQQLGASRSTGS